MAFTWPFKRTPAVAETRPAGSLALTAPTKALEALVFPDGLSSTTTVTRDEALRVPAVSRAVSLISNTISGLELTGAPAWLTESFGIGALPLSLALKLTVEDLILHPAGDALWIIRRDAQGTVVEGAYVRRDQWGTTDAGQITLRGVQLPPENCLYFTAGRPGLCDTAAETIRQYSGLSRAISRASTMPNPRILLKETQAFAGDKETKDAAIKSLKLVLENDAGGIAWVPYGLDLEIMSAAQIDALSAARNETRLDIANFTNLDPDYVAGSKQGGSDTYSNALQGDREFSTLTIQPISRIITDRLNQADVRAKGAPPVAFDFAALEGLAETTSTQNTGNTQPRKEEDPA